MKMTYEEALKKLIENIVKDLKKEEE